MKLIFEIKEERTIVNNTVKVTCLIKGVIGDDDRGNIDLRVQEVANRLFPDAKWAFSFYQELSDGFTFQVHASTRVDAMQNDRLAERANEACIKGTNIEISNIDQKIPQRQMREEESSLRIALIAAAKEEAQKLGGRVERIDFTEMARFGSSTVAASSAFYEAKGSGGRPGPAGAAGIGHSEKIALEAKLEIEVDD